MSWEDRHYHRGGGYGHRPSGPIMNRLAGATMVIWLLGINGVVFMLGMVLDGSRRGHWLAPHEWGYFSIEKGIFGFQVWRWVTYQFLHAGFGHLFFNMLGLFFFGPLMERWWGSRRFLAFYLLCGLGGAGLYTALSMVPGLISTTPGTGLVGASGCLFGVLIGCATLYPNQQVMLMIPPIPMKMRTMAFFFLGFAMLALLADSHNVGGEAAHLGGAVLGWLLVKNPGWLGFADGISVGQIQQNVQRSRRQQLAQEEAQVDRILDKVRQQGLASLTSREKKLLQRATERRHRNAG